MIEKSLPCVEENIKPAFEDKPAPAFEDKPAPVFEDEEPAPACEEEEPARQVSVSSHLYSQKDLGEMEERNEDGDS